jgi:transcriptional regulator with XRE-family HTH domain
MKDILAIFGDNVRHFRSLKGLSQEALAEACGLHRTYVGGIERGERNVSLNNVSKIAKALDVKPQILLTDHET